MKKYVFWGIVLGVAVTTVIMLIRKRDDKGSEFRGFFDSSAVADDWFADAFDELPDAM